MKVKEWRGEKQCTRLGIEPGCGGQWQGLLAVYCGILAAAEFGANLAVILPLQVTVMAVGQAHHLRRQHQ